MNQRGEVEVGLNRSWKNSCTMLISVKSGHRVSSQTYLTVTELKPGMPNVPANNIKTRSNSRGSKTIQPFREQTAGIVVESSEIVTRLMRTNNFLVIEKHQQIYT